MAGLLGITGVSLAHLFSKEKKRKGGEFMALKALTRVAAKFTKTASRVGAALFSQIAALGIIGLVEDNPQIAGLFLAHLFSKEKKKKRR